MVDHIIPGKRRNILISSKVLTVFVLPIQYKGDNGAQGTVRCPLFMIFQHLFQIFAD